MLVGLMSKMNAVSQKSNAQYAMMQNRMNMMNAVRSLPFGGHSMEELHSLDTNLALSNDYNQTLYLLASAQEKFAQQLMKNSANEFKISYMA
ncbi:MAG: hypothetical protein NC191_02065 [Muribaculaceae bacterium]|nr:hypothetical protein [Muribaculaceae bacterium]